MKLLHRSILAACLATAAACAGTPSTPCPMPFTEQTMYCPQCHAICGDTECPIGADGKCLRCGTPAVQTEVCVRSYYECRVHHARHAEPCPAQASDACCSRVLCPAPVLARCTACGVDAGPDGRCPNNPAHEIRRTCSSSGTWPHVGSP